MFEVTTPGSYEVGHRLYLAGAYRPRSAAMQRFDDYLARLALSRSGRPWHEGVTVRAPEESLAEALLDGSVHSSLVEEPRAA